jgi:branched-chain amino acid transport system ATP-binding protein
MLEVRSLCSSHGRVVAVRGLDLSASVGRITLVLGANGAGKTTTLRTIAGLHKPLSGEVLLDGVAVQGWPAHRMVAAGVVLVPEGRRVFAPLTVQENLQLGGYTTAQDTLATAMENVFELFPILFERRRGAAGLLSGGEQQMLAFGRALMSRPKVMLMDEPSMGLAPAVIDTVLGRVRDIADSGISLLVVEQNADLGLEIADDAVVMARGEVVFSGPAEIARTNSSVVRAFLGESALDQPPDHPTVPPS